MVDYNLIHSLGVSDEEVEQQLSQALGKDFNADVLGEMVQDKTVPQPGAILKGRVVNIVGDEAVVEVGLKSEGSVSLHEFADPAQVKPGDEVDVLLDSLRSQGVEAEKVVSLFSQSRYCSSSPRRVLLIGFRAMKKASFMFRTRPRSWRCSLLHPGPESGCSTTVRRRAAKRPILPSA